MKRERCNELFDPKPIKKSVDWKKAIGGAWPTC